jgi:hypothetical protein
MAVAQRRRECSFDEQERPGPTGGQEDQGDMGIYRTAQVCLNGHEINDRSDVNPVRNQDFCGECGERTITACENCNAPIRGNYDVPGVLAFARYVPPGHCHYCGKPYPWLDRKLSAARDLADELDDLSTQERDVLKQSLPKIAYDAPDTQLAAVRIKKILDQQKPTVAAILGNAVKGVATEAAEKILDL